MTTVQVDLLPKEVAKRERSRRSGTGTVVAVVLFVLLLGALYVLKLGEVSSAKEERETVRSEIARLQARVDELKEYRTLAAELDARNTLLAAAMGTEVSYARAFNDLSLSFPASSSLTTLQATRADPEESTPGALPGESVITMEYEGYSVERFSPGVESVLIGFDKVPAFFNTYLVNARDDEISDTPVTIFNGSLQMSAGVLTHRYVNGLPEGEAP